MATCPLLYLLPRCLDNPSVILLEVVEVQTGSYLGEDDIIHFEDIYGRTQ